MQAILQNNIPKVHALCKKHKVKNLWVFGSILTDDYSSNSDVDFLYEFDENNMGGKEFLDHMLAMISGLQRIFKRRVDFIWYPGLKNPYFIKEVESTKKLIYGKNQEISI